MFLLSLIQALPAKIADLALEKLFGVLSRECTYIFRYHEKVKELDGALDDFKSPLEGPINVARYSCREIDETRIAHLDQEEKKTIKEAQNLSLKCIAYRENRRRFCGYIPNPLLQRKLGKNAIEWKMAIGNLRQKNPEGFYRPEEPPGVPSAANTSADSCEDYLPESRAEILDGIIKALQDPDIRLIGVWGAPRMGKTILRKKLVQRAHEENYHTAISIDAPDVQFIQNAIADNLIIGNFSEIEGPSKRKQAIRTRLTKNKGEKILIILDGLQKKLELGEVGIPLKDGKHVCKVVLMSADQNLLVKEMDVPQKNLLRLGVLSGTESKALFQAIVGKTHDDPRKKDIARKIAEESAGFPDLIAEQARDLKNKSTIPSWEDALRSIKLESPRLIDTHVEEILRLNPHAEELRALIRLCGHFKGPVISIQDLTILGKGWGLFHHIDTLAATRNRVKSLIGVLRDYHLVCGNEEHVTIKNLLRKVRLSREEPHVRTEMSINIGDIQDGQYSELKMLLLRAGDSSRDQYLQIPIKFFTNMKELTVLHLTNINFASSPIPSSIKELVKLQTLYLECCKLADVRIVGSLVTLQHLSFSGSDIVRIPIELGKLTDLRLLDLRRCHKLQVIKAGVLNRLTRLEELYLDDRFNNWEVLHHGANPHGEVTKKASLDELGQMTMLSTLHINVTNAAMLPPKLPFEKLESYKVLLGNIQDFSKEENEKSRTLKLSLQDSTTAKNNFLTRNCVKNILERSENLYLEGNIDNLESVEVLSSKGFPQLKHLHVQDNPHIEYVHDEKTDPAFKSLESLTLAKLALLKKICSGSLDSGSFSMLRILKIQHCDKLEVLFKLPLVTSNIEKIEVYECKKMKGIVIDGIEDKIGRKGHMATEEKVRWHNLKHLTLWALPEMTSFITIERTASKSSETADILTAFFYGKQILLPRLESLALIKLPRVTEIWSENIPSAELGNLRYLQVEDCKSLKSVIKHNQIMMLKKLKSVTIKNCPLVEEAFQLDYNLSEPSKPLTPPQHNSRSQKPSGRSRHRNGKNEKKTLNGNSESDTLSRLVELNLIKLQSLKCLWKSSAIRTLRFQDLSYLVVCDCHKLEHLFSATMARGLPQMTHLCIEKCDMLEAIIVPDKLDEGAEPRREEDPVVLKLTFLSLENLKKLATLSREIGSLSFPSLKTLKISNCPELTALFNASNQPLEAASSEQRLMAASSDSEQDVEEWLLQVQGLLDTLLLSAGEWPNLASDANFQDGSLFNQMVTQSLPSLEDLVISKMNFRNIWQGQVSEKSFPKLSRVTVEACERLSHIFPQDMLKSFCNIKRLCISNCISLKHILAVDAEGTKGTNAHKDDAKLTEIYLEGLKKLEHIWPTMDPDRGFIRFTKLQAVSIRECKTVKYLFPVSMTKDLSELKRLEVNTCDGLEQIIKDDELKATSDVPTSTFRNLKFLGLWRLKNLKNLYAKPHILSWSSLTQLMVVECGSIEIFCSTDDFSPHRNCLFWVDENPFSELEILELNRNQLMGKILQGKLPPVEGFSSLKVFKLISPKEKPASFPQEFLQRSANLEVLEVENCQFPIYRSQDEQSKGVPETKLPQFMLSIFRGMSLFHPIKAPPRVHKEGETQGNELVIANNAERIHQGHTAVLQELSFTMLPEVKDLSEGLRFLGISQNSFQRLMALVVSECHHLKYLLTVEMAKSLPHLTRLTVTECKLMEEIVAGKKDGPQEIVAYNFLKCLTLNSLPEIKCFSVGNASFRCSSLEEVIVRQCPKLNKFMSLMAPNLEKVKIEGEEKKLSDYDGNIHTVIEKSYAEMAAFPGMEHVKLSEFPEWMRKWGNLQVKTSCVMRILEISNCLSLVVAVPSKLIDLLGQLEELWVKNCNGLTEVFDLYQDGDQNRGKFLSNLSEIHLQGLDELKHIWKPGQSPDMFSFGNLISLEVANCTRLKSIFTIQMALSLRSLRDMTIAKCTNLKYIISNDDDARLTEKTTVFPELENLALFDLPCLEILHVDYLNLHFRPLRYKPKVINCPIVKGIDRFYPTSDVGYADDRLNPSPASRPEIYSSLALYVILCLLFFSLWISSPAFIQGSNAGPSHE